MRVRILLLAAAVLVASCATNPFAKSSPAPVLGPDETGAAQAVLLPEIGMLPSTTQRFPDVPQPQDVKADIDRSYVYESSTLQIGRMVYTSRASVNELARFYLRACPEAGWTLKNVLEAAGYDMLFEKPGKRLTVTIRDAGPSSVPRGRIIIVNLTPSETSNPVP